MTDRENSGIRRGYMQGALASAILAIATATYTAICGSYVPWLSFLGIALSTVAIVSYIAAKLY